MSARRVVTKLRDSAATVELQSAGREGGGLYEILGETDVSLRRRGLYFSFPCIELWLRFVN